MKAGKKIALLEQALDYTLLCALRVAKVDDNYMDALDNTGVPVPSQEVIDLMAQRVDILKMKGG